MALPMFLRTLGCAALLAAGLASAAADEVAVGRRIYEEGVLSSGAPLQGARTGGDLAGAQAACANCHRHSGMGSVEGGIIVPPITGNALFQRNGRVVAAMDLARLKAFNQRHPPYDEAALAGAIRDGVGSGGGRLGPLMPRYALGERDLRALTAYLKQLSEEWSPGVTATSIRFATVIAPGVAPQRRQAFLDTLRAAVAQKNGSTLPGRRYMTTSSEMVLATGRRWDLEVWELQGAPETWGAQLAEHYRRAPVFAVVSGLSDTTWQPVHDFCQQQAVPCWFPSVELPVASGGFYSLYFSRGVALEADLLAHDLRGRGNERPRRLVQVHRDDYVGNGAAARLAADLQGSGIEVRDAVLKGDGAGALAELLAGVGDHDAVMFWLRPADLAGLERLAPAGRPYFSAILAGEHPRLARAWQGAARLVYPYELPARRRGNLEYFHAWLAARHLPLVDEPMQAEVFFAVAALADTVSGLLDNLHRDYLVERAENMLTQYDSGNAQQQVFVRQTAFWRLAPAVGAQSGTSIYPRISLGPDQRFASKGGYVVRLAGADGPTADPALVVP